MVNEETIGRRETKLGILRKDYPEEIDDLITDPAHPKYPIAKIMMFGQGKNENGISSLLNDSGISFETKKGGTLAERMRINGSGYVGIGTENPPAMLSVKGIEQFEISNAPGVSTTINSQEVHSLSWNDLSKVSVGDTIKIGSDLRIVTEKHDPDHSNLIQGYLTVDSNFSTSNLAASMTVLPNIFRADDEFGFAKLIISNDGLVGIGTEKPSAMLTIKKKNNTIIFNVTIGYGSYNTMYGTYCINIGNDPRFSKIKVGDIVSINSKKPVVLDIYGNFIKLEPVFGSNFTQYNTTMIFTENSGGINTPFFRIEDPIGKAKFSIESDGSVGIGTTTPSHKLTVEADATGDWASDDCNAQLVLRGATNTNLRLGIGVDTTKLNARIQAGTRAVDLLIQPDGGNVGIGIVAPLSKKLEVNGTVKASDFEGKGSLLTDLNATYITSGELADIRIPSTISRNGHPHTAQEVNALSLDGGIITKNLVVKGSVGIGAENSDPNAKLLVNGNLKISDGEIIQEDWKGVSLINNWKEFNTSSIYFNIPGYFRDKNGIVHLRGHVWGGSANTTIFILESTYRPRYNEKYVVPSGNGAAIIDIKNNGEVVAELGESNLYSLDGITFRAEL